MDAVSAVVSISDIDFYLFFPFFNHHFYFRAQLVGVFFTLTDLLDIP